MNLGCCLGNKLVIAVPLNLPEQDVGVGDRTQRIQRNAGGRIRGDLLNTIDVDLESAVVACVTSVLSWCISFMRLPWTINCIDR
jgi:hypothetical protein